VKPTIVKPPPKPTLSVEEKMAALNKKTENETPAIFTVD